MAVVSSWDACASLDWLPFLTILETPPNKVSVSVVLLSWLVWTLANKLLALFFDCESSSIVSTFLILVEPAPLLDLSLDCPELLPNSPNMEDVATFCPSFSFELSLYFLLPVLPDSLSIDCLTLVVDCGLDTSYFLLLPPLLVA